MKTINMQFHATIEDIHKFVFSLIESSNYRICGIKYFPNFTIENVMKNLDIADIKKYDYIVLSKNSIPSAKNNYDLKLPTPIGVGSLSNELVDILAKMDELKDERNAGGWDNWRKLEGKSFFRERAIKNATLNNRWPDMNEEEKVRCAKNLISPFTATEEELRSFIDEVDKEFISSELPADNNV